MEHDMKIKCDYCGKEFEQNLYEIKNNKKHFCSRMCYDTNRKQREIIIKKEYAELIINSLKYGKKIVKIDKEDISNIKDYQWVLNTIKKANGDLVFYIQARKDDKTIMLHRHIMNAPKGKVIDHINRNTLDNRKCNLRICEHYQNMRNTSANNTHRGVYWHSFGKQWIANISVNAKLIHLGYFKNIEDAIKARMQAEIIYNVT